MRVNRSNWVKKYEERQEDWEEKQRMMQLKRCDSLLLEKKTKIKLEEQEIIRLLERKIEIYQAMKKEQIEYSQQEYIATSKELAERRYHLLLEKQREEPEEKSWCEYRQEEEIEDKKEERE